MPKTFHFTATFDVKLVLQEKDLEEVQKLLSAVDSDSSHAAKIDQKRTGMGKSLDERIVLMARATLRNGVAELLAEEFPEGYSFSPAKVTQVVIPRIETTTKARHEQLIKCPECGDEVIGGCQPGMICY